MNIFHRGKEWDPLTESWVRRGWVAERQAITDQFLTQVASGEQDGGTCLACGLPLMAHPMPDRIWRSSPELCAIARARENQ